jgi:hypothetical protein
VASGARVGQWRRVGRNGNPKDGFSITNGSLAAAFVAAYREGRT